MIPDAPASAKAKAASSPMPLAAWILSGDDQLRTTLLAKGSVRTPVMRATPCTPLKAIPDFLQLQTSSDECHVELLGISKCLSARLVSKEMVGV